MSVTASQTRASRQTLKITQWYQGKHDIFQQYKDFKIKQVTLY